MKAIEDKPTTNLILGGERLKTFPVRLGTGQECILLSLLLNIALARTSSATRQEKEMVLELERKK